MIIILLSMSLIYDTPKPEVVTDAEKKELLELLPKLPHKGEFYTSEGIKTAIPYQRVLFALSEKDAKEEHFYQLGALSFGLCEDKDCRAYAVKNFESIKHPILKMMWASMLFEHQERKPEIVQYLKEIVESKDRSEILSGMTGPNFEKLKKDVLKAAESIEAKPMKK